MAICSCKDGIYNSGIPNCVDGFDRFVKLVFVNQYANDATQNTIDCSLLSNATYLEGKLNNPDKSKRWYPTGKLYQVVDERGDSVTETIDNLNFIVTQGTRTFTALFLDKGTNQPKYLKFLKSLACPKVGYFAIDENGNAVGVDLGGGMLAPFPVQSLSLDAKGIPATASALAKNQLTFALDSLLQDETVSYIPASDFIGSLLNINGLLNVNLAEGSISGTFDSVGVVATLEYGNVCNALPFTAGTDVTDWTVFNVTTSSAVTVTSVTVSGTGENIYDLAFAAQSSSDVMRVTLDKVGFESQSIQITFP